MADSDYVSSQKVKIRQGLTGNNRPVSEALMNNVAGDINGLIDSDYMLVQFGYEGYYSTDGDIFRGPGLRLRADYELIGYELSVIDTGNTGNNGMNVRVTDTTGALVGTLFGTGANRVSISANNASNRSVERDLIAGTTTQHGGAATVQFGNPSFTTLSDGYFLEPYVEQFTDGARGISLNLYLREV